MAKPSSTADLKKTKSTKKLKSEALQDNNSIQSLATTQDEKVDPEQASVSEFGSTKIDADLNSARN
jgi:hypothetical protein